MTEVAARLAAIRERIDRIQANQFYPATELPHYYAADVAFLLALMTERTEITDDMVERGATAVTGRRRKDRRGVSRAVLGAALAPR